MISPGWSRPVASQWLVTRGALWSVYGDGDYSPICYCFFSCISTLNIVTSHSNSTDMKECVAILLLVSAIFCQDDPCSPNPCGPNTRCMSVLIRKQPVISCECLIGYKYPVGGSQDDGCIEVGGLVYLVENFSSRFWQYLVNVTVQHSDMLYSYFGGISWWRDDQK